MEGSGEGRSERDALDRRGTWFAQQLGEGWTEVEPGIYRFDAGFRMASPSESPTQRDLLEALNPAEDARNPARSPTSDADDPQPTRRLFRRRAQT
jgi:hypothetical protein